MEEEEEEDVVGEGGRELGELPSLLNTAKGLHLEGLSVGAPLPVVFVLAAMVVTLHDVLVTTVAGVLVTNPATCSEKTHDKCLIISSISNIAMLQPMSPLISFFLLGKTSFYRTDNPATRAKTCQICTVYAQKVVTSCCNFKVCMTRKF